MAKTLFLFLLVGLMGACSEGVPSEEASIDPPRGEESVDPDLPLYKRVETPPAPVLNAAQAHQTFTIAPEFRIDLAAAEPMIEDPVAADWDEDGNLYVAEMRAFMEDLDGSTEERPIGSVVRLIDHDGDGIFDEREELINDLVLPRAVRIVNEGLLIAEMGKLWLCPSASGWSRDIDCSAKQFLGVYGEHQGSVEHAENGLLVGLDNWLYNAKSSRRLKLVDGELIEEPTIFRGQWGITQDESGRLFYNTNSNLIIGDYYDSSQVVAGGNFKAAGLNERVSPNDEVYSVRVNTGVNRAYLPGTLREDGRLRSATAASGLVVYQGGALDVAADHVPHAYVTEPGANLIAAFKLITDDLKVVSEQMTYADETWGQRDFLVSTDERFRPVDVLNSPSGAIYVLDFYRGVIQDHVFLTDELKEQARARKLIRPLGMGRIWRISALEESEQAALPDWQNLSNAELVELLAAPDIWRRNTAQRLLIRSQADDAKDNLVTAVKSAPEPAAVRALWILRDRGELDAATASVALGRSDELVQAALLAASHLLSADSIIQFADEANPSRTQLYGLGALRQHNSDGEVLERLSEVLVAQYENKYVSDVLKSALRGEELGFVQALVAGGQWQADQEKGSRFIQGLAQQMFRAEGAAASSILDYVQELDTERHWVAEALLTGLFERTRENGFARAELEQPHPLFVLENEALWSVVSKARIGFTWPGDTLAADAKPLTPAQSVARDMGADFYTTSCANCHGADGAGVGALGPPLADSPWVKDAPERLARIVLGGLSGPIEVAGQEWNSAMPGHRDFEGFDDQVASGLLTHLRRSWGHAGRAIDPDFVSQIRAQTAERTALWTVAELLELDINTHYQKYVGQYGRPDQPLGFEYDGQDLIVKGGIYNGPVQEEKEDHFLFVPRGLRFEFVTGEDGLASAVLINIGSEIMTLPRVNQ